MKYIYFLKYNNYANRIFKRESSVSDYLSNSYGSDYIQLITDCTMWNPNDGITAQITTPNNTDFSIEPDYLIAADEYSNIDSRWFITETVRDRKGQYQCYLKRDVFADAWDELMNATCNIDRAILNKYSKLVFNPEPISVNQIITDEWEIKDKTECPWIVFYGKEKPGSVSRSLSYNYDFTVSDISDYLTANNYKYLPEDGGSIQLAMLYLPSVDGGLRQFKMLPYGYQGDVNYSGSDTFFNRAKYPIHFTNADNVPNYVGDFKTVFSLKGSYEAQQTMFNNGKVAYDTGSSKFYRITSYFTDYYSYNQLMTSPTLLTDAKYILSNYTDIQYTSGHNVNDVNANNIRVYYRYRQMVTVASEVMDVTTISAQVPSGGYEPTDTPYFIWAMPYGNITINNTVSGVTTTVTTDKDINLSVAMKFSSSNSSGKLYDFQILPFCPLPDEFINSDGSISVVDNSNLTDNSTLTKTVGGITSTVGFIFSVPNATFTRRIVLETPITVDDPKLRNITDMWRLSSPNYASSFEFSVAKNGGLTGFNVRCTYMPINPYIRVAPIFGGLYGSFFEENVRGLICGGDYSMARIADAWVNYQEQNKNFEAIFNRQIDNMDVMRGYERTEQIVGSAVGAVGAGTIGAKFGGVAGGIVGGVGGIASGIADVFIGEGKYREGKSYATDIHQLQLGNVQAMPRTLARTTAFNVDNRYFPILTLYRCSSDEFISVVNFIANRSMSVGIIDTPISYVNNTWSFASTTDRGFIQGSIIKIDSVHDTHFVDELNNEFQKGVYMR